MLKSMMGVVGQLPQPAIRLTQLERPPGKAPHALVRLLASFDEQHLGVERGGGCTLYVI